MKYAEDVLDSQQLPASREDWLGIIYDILTGKEITVLERQF